MKEAPAPRTCVAGLFSWDGYIPAVAGLHGLSGGRRMASIPPEGQMALVPCAVAQPETIGEASPIGLSNSTRTSLKTEVTKRQVAVQSDHEVIKSKVAWLSLSVSFVGGLSCT